MSKIAIDIYLVPPIPSGPERDFSSAKHTITDQRYSLNIDSIELLECLKLCFRIGIFIEENLYSAIKRTSDIVGTVEEDLYSAIKRTGDIVGTVEEALGNE